MAAVFRSAVVCEGLVDDDDVSDLSCLKIFLSLSIVLGRSSGQYDLGGVLAAWSISDGLKMVRGKRWEAQELATSLWQ